MERGGRGLPWLHGLWAMCGKVQLSASLVLAGFYCGFDVLHDSYWGTR